MDKAQRRRQGIIALRCGLITHQFVGMPQIQIERPIKRLPPFIRNGVGPCQGDLVPAQRLSRRRLVPSDIGSSDTGFIIILRCFPCLLRVYIRLLVCLG